jgi:PKD repeat protein
MKTMKRNLMRRTWAVLATGIALGGMFASSAHASVYQMKNNYTNGTVAPYNAGGGVPCQSLITTNNTTNNTNTIGWYGTMGWYTIQGSLDGGPWTNLTTVAATDFAWQTSLISPTYTNTAMFRLSQANSYAGQANCSGCHGDVYNTWNKTRHAVAITEHLNPDGSFIPGHSTACLPCHTVGYGQTNAGGYVYDPNAGAANYSSPMANVGCECCHGPAGWHKNSQHDAIRPVVSVDPAICGSCHTGPVHPTYTEYTNSITAGLFPGLSHSHPSQSSSTGCAVCHSANNRMVMLNEYNDMLAGNSHPLTLVTGSDATLWTATCATCHDPHDASKAGQLRYATSSTNWYTMPTTFDSRTVTVTNGSSVSTTTVNYNTVFDSLYNPNIQVCGQCHNTRGARWDGNAYTVVTNTPQYGSVSQVSYVDLYCTNTFTQVFTNSQGVPYLTNTYNQVYVCGRAATTNVVSVQTNPVYGVSVITPLIAYTNNGVLMYATNSSGYGRVQHYSPQYNILIGMADYDYSTFVPRKTAPHTSAPDQCATCHVPNYATGPHSNNTGHTFTLDYNGCLTSCHSSYTADALTAKINNLQTIESNNMVRVVSLLNQWALTKATGPLTNYAQMAWEFTSPGMLSSPDATHKVGPPSAFNPKVSAVPGGDAMGTNDNLQLQIPQDIRIARFDLYMAYNDQSKGVHNPAYVQALLDDAATRVGNQFPAANFTANTVAGFAPLTVKFTNVGGTGNSYNWTFGDGNSATIANPTNVYTTPGIYAVTCTANGTETLTKTNYIRVLNAPTLSFVADQTNVLVGTTVNFSNTSANTQDVFRWDWYPMNGVTGAPSFTQAGSSTGFSYTYTNTGTFSVQLRANCPGGANGSYNRVSLITTNYITVHN